MAQHASRTQLRSSPLEASSSRAIDALLDETVRRGERWLSICRIPFNLVSFVLSAPWTWRDDDGRLSPRAWLIMSIGGCLIALSIWIIRRSLRGPIPRWMLGLSVAADAIMSCVALLGNALWSSEGYRGNFRSLHGGAILLSILISGFRLSSFVVWLSVGLNTLSAIIIIYADSLVPSTGVTFRAWGPRVAIYIAAAAAVALIIARQTRTLVMAGARHALRAHRSQHALNCLLQDHHDVRSVLSSVNLNAELVLRGLADGHPQKENAESLRQDLRTASTLIAALRERSFQELTSADGCLEANLAEAVRAASAIVSRRFPNVGIESDVPDELRVGVVGGSVLLERLLLNLMVNACEGDGTRGAGRILIHAHRDKECVRVSVEDDGPGFPEAMLREPLAHTGTSKREGSGLGLFLVQSVVTASKGYLSLGQQPEGGACVNFRLPGQTA